MRFFLLAIIVCLLTPSGAPLHAARDAEKGLSLTQVGYRDGFHSVLPAGGLTFYLPLPQDPRLSGAVLDLSMESTSLAGPGSNLRVSVNGTPRKAVGLEGRGQVAWNLAIPITARDLDRRFLEVNLTYTLRLGRDRCEDQTLGGGFIRVLPETALRFKEVRPAINLRSFLESLPEDVTLALPDPSPSIPMLQSAWVLADGIQRSGRKVHFTGQAAECQVLVASASTLAALEIRPTPGASFFLHREGERTRLVLGAPFEAALAMAPWRDLLTEEAYGPSSSDPKALLFGRGDRVPLSRFGLNDGLRQIEESGEWHLYLEPRLLPAGRRPGTLVLDVVAGTLPDPIHMNLYLYMDGVLIQGEALRRDGRPQTFTVPVSAALAEGPGRVRLVVSRNDPGDCSRPLPKLPIQVLPTSTLLLESDDRPLEGFRDLARVLPGSCEVFMDIPKGEAPRFLSLMLQASQTMGLEPTRTVFRSTTGADPKGPFLWFGSTPLAGFSGAVRFDRGPMQVLDGAGISLLDTAPLKGVGVAQVIRKGSQRGIWFRGADKEGLPPLVAGLALDRGDLAFFDSNGTVLSLNSREEELMRVAYPAFQNWFQTVGRYRPWFLAALWLAATAALVVGYRKFRKSRRSQGEA